MKKILVPTDFSPASRNAADYAANFSQVMAARLVLLHAFNEFLPIQFGPKPLTLSVSELHLENERKLNKEIEQLQKKYNADISGEVRVGYRSDSIKDMSEELPADLIMMGMHLDKEIYRPGNTIMKTIRKTRTPVLLVPDKTAYRPIKNIIMAIDFHEVIHSACFDPLYEIVKKYDASLRVVHIEKRGMEIIPGELPEKLSLGHVLSKFNYIYNKVEYNDVAAGIHEFTAGHPADLLVLVAHHHNIFERIFGNTPTLSAQLDLGLPVLVLKN